MSNASRVVAALGACVCLACGGDDAATPDDTTGVVDTTGSPDDEDTSTGAPAGESSDDESAVDETTAASELCDELEFDNVVDAAACPYVQGKGVEPTPAGEVELCRRYFVDLVGRVPTSDEVATTCSGRTPAEIVES
jgi:hypothetical protein